MKLVSTLGPWIFFFEWGWKEKGKGFVGYSISSLTVRSDLVLCFLLAACLQPFPGQ
jgi:hypothetical protein